MSLLEAQLEHDVDRKSFQKNYRNQFSLPSHLVDVLKDEVRRALLLDDHCCDLPCFRVLAEMDWICELPNLFLPTLMIPRAHGALCFALFRFTSTHRLLRRDWFVIFFSVCYEYVSLPAPPAYSECMFHEDAWEDLLAEMMKPRFVCRKLWDHTQLLRQNGTISPVTCSLNQRS